MGKRGREGKIVTKMRIVGKKGEMALTFVLLYLNNIRFIVITI